MIHTDHEIEDLEKRWRDGTGGVSVHQLDELIAALKSRWLAAHNLAVRRGATLEAEGGNYFTWNPEDPEAIDSLVCPVVIPPEDLLRILKERDDLRACVEIVNGIRNSIVGTATFNWSEHLYPLVAALNAAGIVGMEYPEARKYFGTMLERTNKAEARVAELEAEVKRLENAAIIDGCRSAG